MGHLEMPKRSRDLGLDCDIGWTPFQVSKDTLFITLCALFRPCGLGAGEEI